MFTMSEIYHLAMRLEENGEAFYRRAMEKAITGPIKDLLHWLMDEEVAHRQWFAQKEAAIKGTSDDTALNEVGNKMLQDIMREQTFSLGEADLGEMHGAKEMIRLAIDFEEDTIIFFNMIAMLVGDKETLGGLNEIIEEEKRHVTLLKEKLQEDIM
ncbi:MAG: ferritin family protein [Deltaproteobacteria bacterium]|nr:ferritin family protein [Deltaproteobacteria bacterium]MBW2136087.1 ferritin family protein [Deltaproteobacteria bacterium]